MAVHENEVLAVVMKVRRPFAETGVLVKVLASGVLPIAWLVCAFFEQKDCFGG
jgi:hypothetical protein